MEQSTMQRVLCVTIAGVILCLLPFLGETAEEKTLQPQEASPSPSPGAIPLAEVATRATELANLLQALSARFAASPSIETIRKELPHARAQMDMELAWTMRILGEEPALETIQVQQRIWHERRVQTAAWLKTLTERAVHLRDAMSRLEYLKRSWTETLNAAQTSSAPGPVLQQIRTVISAVDASRTLLEAQHDDVLDLQATVSQEVSRCESVSAQIIQAQEKAVGGILVRERLPLWSAELRERTWTDLPGRIREIAVDSWTDILDYVREPSRGMPIHVGLFVAFPLLLHAVRRRTCDWAATDPGAASAAMVLERPYSAALIISIFIATMPASPVPPTVRILLGMLGVLAMIRLLQPSMTQETIRILCAMAVLIALDGARKRFSGVQPIEQGILLLELLSGIAVLGWILLSGTLRRIAEHLKEQVSTQVFHAGVVLLTLDLIFGLAATTLGYTRLARISVPFALGIGILVLALYTTLQVFVGLVFLALRAWPLRLLKMVRNHRDMLARRICRILVLLAVVAGLSRSLAYLGFLEPVLSFGEALLSWKLERGTFSISLGDILAFMLTIWVAYLLSAFIRFVLQEDVYPRMNVDRGQSYAASSLLNYTILTLGFATALGVIGVNLTNITVLAGALGVGIGFGLQSVVNNFVSGLILLFERPIHVGDTIEVGNLIGEVGRIGIRASTVRTSQGADILVPNAHLVTEKITNWTLGDRLRRIDLRFGVNHGAAPGKVIEVVEAVALVQPRVLRNPRPRGLFAGFGESSINFELQAWTDHFADYSLIRSELTMALYQAIQEAGMSFSYPRREVRIDNAQSDEAGPGSLSRTPAAAISPKKQDE